jgi:AcrR family transcriptional regulator
MAKLATAPPSTRERILEAAFTLFGRYGFKRTSMEDIASEAGLSRAGLYLQFRNKEDIFRDLAGGLHDEGLLKAEAALDEAGPLVERLRASVEAKTLRMMEIVNASPHGNELLDEKNRLCGDLATDSERRFREMLTAAFKSADAAGEIDLAAAELSASEAADLFASAVNGVKDTEGTASRYRKLLASLVRVFVAGLGA